MIKKPLKWNVSHWPVVPCIDKETAAQFLLQLGQEGVFGGERDSIFRQDIQKQTSAHLEQNVAYTRAVYST